MFKIKLVNIVYILLFSIPNTILSFGILYIINNVISGNTDFIKDYMGIVFISTIVYTYLLNIIFQKNLNKYTYELLYENEKIVFDKILKTPLITLEKKGAQRFYTAVEDLRFFSALPDIITHTINSLLYLLLCVVYLFTLSVSSALIVVVLIIGVAGLYFFVISTMSGKVSDLRLLNEKYYSYVEDVMRGFKELKMSVQRRKKLMTDYLAPNRDKAKVLDFNVNFTFLSINLISQYGLYFVIGVILFYLPEFGLLDRADVTSYVVILLFISGPINNLINMQNAYTRLMVANRRIKEFIKDFDDDAPALLLEKNPSFEFTSLEFKNIKFNYENTEDFEDSTFVLGPLDITINKGETIFIVGGNGSGKSTFINVLTGLYKPSEGNIILNNATELDVDNEFQRQMSAIFTDNHIFSHNYDDYQLEGNQDYSALLKTMKLDEVVLDDKEESARRAFSKGQSKRMSMIFALLENKPILVLDEWAADQDPHFRKYFYEELLPKLKEEGKTILAVTHDDAYFKHADRIIKFDYGRIVKDLSLKDKVHDSEALWYNNTF